MLKLKKVIAIIVLILSVCFAIFLIVIGLTMNIGAIVTDFMATIMGTEIQQEDIDYKSLNIQESLEMDDYFKNTEPDD